jgi:general secretion pathway protein E
MHRKGDREKLKYSGVITAIKLAAAAKHLFASRLKLIRNIPCQESEWYLRRLASYHKLSGSAASDELHRQAACSFRHERLRQSNEMHGSQSALKRVEVASYLRVPTGQPASLPVSPEWLLSHSMCPVAADDSDSMQLLVTGVTDPTAVRDLECAIGVAFRTHATTPDVVERAVERFRRSAMGDDAPLLISQGEDSDADTRGLASQPPVIRYVNLLVREAVAIEASDIHLEVGRAGLVTRFRIDGLLSEGPAAPAGMHVAVVSRCKLLAGLDIAEKRRPQDGRIRMRLADRDLDLRVSTVPTLHGESVVIRLLDRGNRPVALEALGMPGAMLTQLEPIIRQPQGLVLVTGPTGSGKTTTLYAALAHRNNGAEKLITVEDPVEYQIPGVTQVPVHHATGVSFATALRAILRQDPDVLLIGELRDTETAAVAIQAAMTGHLVLATLHTNDAVSAFPRLLDLGVPEYLLTDTVTAVVAQRLVRRVCEVCTTRVTLSEEDARFLSAVHPSLSMTDAPHGVGCAACRGTGFRGRVGVFETVLPNAALRQAIAAGAGHDEMRRCLRESGGYVSLAEDGIAKVATGVTTVGEVRRVACV